MLANISNTLITKLREGVTGRIVSGAFWVIVGTVISKILVFIATMAVARILVKDVYGQLGIIRSTIQLFVSLSAFGLGATATKYIAQYRKVSAIETAKVYCIANIFILLMAVLASGVLLISADAIATDRLNAPQLSTDIRIAGVILFFTLITGAQTGTLAGFEDFRRISFSNTIMGFSEVILLCCGAYWWGLRGAILGFGITYLIGSIYNSYYIRNHLKAESISVRDGLKNLKLSDFKILFSFSLPLAANSWIQMAVYWWMKTVVVRNAGFENMANYDVGEQWKAQIMFIPGILQTVMLPILSNVMDSQKDKKIAIKINLLINASTTIILGLIVICLGDFILFFYGSSYTNPIPLYILAISTVFDSIANVYGTALISANKAPMTLISNFAWTFVLIISFNIVMQYNGAFENKLATSYFVAGSFQALIVYYIARKSKIC